MSLNPNYVLAPSLQEYFVDKDTGLPLAGGQVFFWSDVNRSIPKTVYELSGSPPSYSYTALPNPSTLSGVGTFQDAGGQDILPYWYPYDSDGNVELYFVQVFDSNGNEQFARQAWPNIIATSPDGQTTNVTNYVPNGQFLLHNNIPENVITDKPEGQISGPITILAPGGFYFERPSGTTSTDTVTFVPYGAYVTDPTSSPQYSCQVVCSGSNPSDAYKYLTVRYSDVNKFASDTDEYTFAFYAVTVDSGNFTVGLNLLKNFGTGGSPSSSTTTQLTTFNITSTLTLFQYSFTFGDNIGKGIGTNGDSYVELATSFPTNITFGAQFTDFMHLGGAVTISAFPTQTDANMLTRSLIPNIPDYYGYDFYLPRVNTPYGETYDDSDVGKFFPYPSLTPPISHLNCFGDTSYRTDAYSADGIPYARYYNKFADANGLTPGGTGPQYVMTFTNGAANLLVSTNQFGAQTVTADVNTGFSAFTSNAIATTPNYGFIANIYHSGSVNNTSIWIQCLDKGRVFFAIGPGTSGYVVNTFPNPNQGEQIGNADVAQRISVNLGGTLPTPGTYFQIATPIVSYYVWFQINGSGSDPAPGGTGIKINLSSITNDSTYIAFIIAQIISGFQSSTLACTAGSSIPANSYWTFHANSQLYYVWYSLNGSGTDPAPSSGIGISVSYTTAQTSTQIAKNTSIAINRMYWATPDISGMMIKCYDNGAYPGFSHYNDSNIQYRYLNSPFGNMLTDAPIGSYQYDIPISHSHNLLQIDVSPTGKSGFYLTPTFSANNAGYVSDTNANTTIGFDGTAGNDVKNIYLNYIMKY